MGRDCITTNTRTQLSCILHATRTLLPVLGLQPQPGLSTALAKLQGPLPVPETSAAIISPRIPLYYLPLLPSESMPFSPASMLSDCLLLAIKLFLLSFLLAPWSWSPCTFTAVVPPGTVVTVHLHCSPAPWSPWSPCTFTAAWRRGHCAPSSPSFLPAPHRARVHHHC